MRHVGSLAKGALLLATLCVLSPIKGSAQDTDAVNRELVDLEGRADQLLREPLDLTRLRSPTYVEERLTDGELFYRLQDYLRASIIFTDIVENYENHRAFPDALFLLGDSLYRAGDYLGARTRLRQLISHSGERAFRPFLERSLGRLIEIAIHIRDFSGVDEYFVQLSRLPPNEVAATTNYFRAKYLYNRAVPSEMQMRESGSGRIDTVMLDEARQAFESVAQGSLYYSQSLYFIGVIYVLREQFPLAIEAFRRALRAPAESEEAREVLQLTHLALGRLYYETNQLDQAAEAYQRVARTSSHFSTALYEIAWVYIRMGDATRAERALEVLTVAAPDSRYIPDGQLLRANLLLRNGRFADATELFEGIYEEFNPVREQLDELVEGHADPLAYFRNLVRDNMESFDANAFLPPLAQRWARTEGDSERALSVLSDLAQARRLVRETADLVERLDSAISQPNQIAVYADLRRQRERSDAIRTRLGRLRQTLLRAYERQGGRIQGDRAERRELEQSLEAMPTSESDYADFNEIVLERYRLMERELGRLEIELQGMEARIVAMERYLRDTEEGRDEAGVAAIQNELIGHRRAVETFRTRIRELSIALETARIQVGPGDARHTRNDEMRQRYRRIAESERASMDGQHEEVASFLDRVSTLEARLDQRDEEVNDVVRRRSTDVHRQIREESERLVGYRAALTDLERETEDVVGGVTYINYRQVQSRFYDLVLRADVGQVDVAWAVREEHRLRGDMLRRSRDRELRRLDDEFREIMGEEDSPSSSAPSLGGGQ